VTISEVSETVTEIVTISEESEIVTEIVTISEESEIVIVLILGIEIFAVFVLESLDLGVNFNFDYYVHPKRVNVFYVNEIHLLCR
jgi:hypothetical protein